MVLDLLNCAEVLFLVGFVLFGGVFVLVVGALEFVVHLNYISFQGDQLVD